MTFASVNGEGKATKITEDDGWAFSVEKYTDSYNFDTVGTKTVTIVATQANDEGEADDVVIKAENVKIEIINDYPIAYTVSQNKNAKDEYDEYAWKDPVEAKNFTFTASEWASGYTEYKEEPTDGELGIPTGYTKPTFTAVPSIIPEGTSTDDLYAIPFMASDESEVEWAGSGAGLAGVTVVEKHE